jgi:integrase
MPVHKYTRGGKVSWLYKFDAPASTRETRIIIQKWGFATKTEAQNAEAARRIEQQEKHELAQAGSGVAAAPPKTLGMLLEEFFRHHAEEKLTPTTIQGYREKAAYLDPQLLTMPLAEITPLHLNREWTRLLKSGGHYRKTKAPRPLSRKTVRHVAGLVSSAFIRAAFWGVVSTNPVKFSQPPVPKKHKAIALTVAQQDMLIESATGPWCIATFLKVGAALGARRGEILALRWKDIVDGRVTIARSLAQVKDIVTFKETKTEDVRNRDCRRSDRGHLGSQSQTADDIHPGARGGSRVPPEQLAAETEFCFCDHLAPISPPRHREAQRQRSTSPAAYHGVAHVGRRRAAASSVRPFGPQRHAKHSPHLWPHDPWAG